jgi:hypothetical protein
VSPFELQAFTKFIDMLMLLNCAYIGVFKCTFADPVPKLENGAIYLLLTMLPVLLNVVVLIPMLIFCFSLVSAVCKLDTNVLATVLERGEEVTMQLLDLQMKMKRRVTQRGGTLLDFFNEIDVDDNGGVDKEEFRHALHKLNIFISQASLNRLFRAVDLDTNGKIVFREFSAAFENHDEDVNHIEQQMRDHLAGKVLVSVVSIALQYYLREAKQTERRYVFTHTNVRVHTHTNTIATNTNTTTTLFTHTIPFSNTHVLLCTFQMSLHERQRYLHTLMQSLMTLRHSNRSSS